MGGNEVGNEGNKPEDRFRVSMVIDLGGVHARVQPLVPRGLKDWLKVREGFLRGVSRKVECYDPLLTAFIAWHGQICEG